MKLIIGITGSIGTGKSTVSNLIKAEGYPIIDTDSIVHDIYKKDLGLIKKLVKEFGDGILTKTKDIDRKKLGEIVFGDKDKLRKLNELVHPLVKEKTLKMIEKLDDGLIFLDVPLLFETDFYKLCDYTVVVYADMDNQIWRIMARDKVDFPTALKKIYSQMSLQEKIELADFIIDNSHSIGDLPWQVKQLIIKLKGLI